MKRTTIFVDEALEQDLKAIAGNRRQPVASLVREALAEYVTREKRASRTTLSFVAAGASGHADTADRHEELLWQETAGISDMQHSRGVGRKSRTRRDVHPARSR